MLARIHFEVVAMFVVGSIFNTAPEELL